MKRRNQMMIAAGVLGAAGAALAGRKYGPGLLRRLRQSQDETTANGADRSTGFRPHSGVSSPHGDPVTAH